MGIYKMHPVDLNNSYPINYTTTNSRSKTHYFAH